MRRSAEVSGVPWSIRTGVLFAGFFVLCSVVAWANGQPPSVLFILDASGSMWGQVEGRTKIEIAREVIRDEVVEKLPAEMPIGLMAYGHNREGDCGDIELVAAVGDDRQALIDTVFALSPKGMTPITASLTRAAEVVRGREGRAEIVLVSDGKETCEGDPCAATKALRESGAELRVHVVAFDVGAEEEQQLQCIAREGGGIYARAKDAAQLREAIGEIEQAIVAAPEPEPAKTVVRRRRRAGTISVPNVEERLVHICTPGSACYNTASDGYLGTLRAGETSMEVMAGTYELAMHESPGGASHFKDVVVTGGETTEVLLGKIGVANLDSQVNVCTPDSSCYNSSSDGFMGLLTPEHPVIEVFPGTYKLKFGEQYEEDLVVEPGVDLILE